MTAYDHCWSVSVSSLPSPYSFSYLPNTGSCYSLLLFFFFYIYHLLADSSCSPPSLFFLLPPFSSVSESLLGVFPHINFFNSPSLLSVPPPSPRPTLNQLATGSPFTSRSHLPLPDDSLLFSTSVSLFSSPYPLSSSPLLSLSGAASTLLLPRGDWFKALFLHLPSPTSTLSDTPTLLPFPTPSFFLLPTLPPLYNLYLYIILRLLVILLPKLTLSPLTSLKVVFDVVAIAAGLAHSLSVIWLPNPPRKLLILALLLNRRSSSNSSNINFITDTSIHSVNLFLISNSSCGTRSRSTPPTIATYASS